MADERGDIHSGRTGAYDPRGLAPWLVLLGLLALAAGASLLLPKMAAGFSLVSTGFEDGKEDSAVPFTLHDYRGQVVVLDFMGVTCLPCREVTEDVLKPLWREYNGKGFTIVSIDAWADPQTPEWRLGLETRESLVALQNSSGVPWRHALDTDHVAAKYGVLPLPHLVVVAPDGRVVFDEQGVPALADVEAVVRGNLP